MTSETAIPVILVGGNVVFFLSGEVLPTVGDV